MGTSYSFFGSLFVIVPYVFMLLIFIYRNMWFINLYFNDLFMRLTPLKMAFCILFFVMFFLNSALYFHIYSVVECSENTSFTASTTFSTSSPLSSTSSSSPSEQQKADYIKQTLTVVFCVGAAIIVFLIVQRYVDLHMSNTGSDNSSDVSVSDSSSSSNFSNFDDQLARKLVLLDLRTHNFTCSEYEIQCMKNKFILDIYPVSSLRTYDQALDALLDHQTGLTVLDDLSVFLLEDYIDNHSDVPFYIHLERMFEDFGQVPFLV
jgi:hypothetical protein